MQCTFTCSGHLHAVDTYMQWTLTCSGHLHAVDTYIVTFVADQLAVADVLWAMRYSELQRLEISMVHLGVKGEERRGGGRGEKG